VINALKETNITNVVLENTSDTLLIDNWRMLHGRSAIPDGGDGRIIERVYLGDKT
jgi:alpha-ketoglutarate-dependent taurine dioxygenase